MNVFVYYKFVNLVNESDDCKQSLTKKLQNATHAILAGSYNYLVFFPQIFKSKVIFPNQIEWLSEPGPSPLFLSIYVVLFKGRGYQDTQCVYRLETMSTHILEKEI